jgi:hypothetical protein
MISNIITKEFHNINSLTNILWTPVESVYFTEFIKRSCDPCSLIDFDKTYYGINDVSIVVCNNRIIYLEKCIDLAKFFHCPLLIIDHDIKSNLISENFVVDIPFDPVFQIALSKDIHFSWGKTHNLILNTGDTTENIEKWKNLFFQLIKSRFVIKEDKYENTKA